MTQHENFALSENHSVSILRSTLSEGSVQAYIACLHFSDPVIVYIPDAAITEAVFPFRIAWRPDYRAPTAARLVVTVTNGKIDGKKSKELIMQPTDMVPLQVERDNNGLKSLFITAYINGKASDPTSLPPLPSFKVILEPKFEPPLDKPAAAICRSGDCGTEYLKHDICVYPDKDTIVLPSTLEFRIDKVSWRQKPGKMRNL